MPAAVWWIRRDLRLTDNPALQAALAQGGQVIPLFILDPALWRGSWFNPRRAAFLVKNLKELDTSLQARGSRLIVRQGAPLAVISQLVEQQDISAIFAEADHSPYAQKRDHAVVKNLPLRLVGSSLLYPPDSLLKADGTPYTVYTPFMRRWKQNPPPSPASLLPAPAAIPTPISILSDPLPDLEYDPAKTGFPAGESEALRRLQSYAQGAAAGIYLYRQQRDHPGLDSTSKLSPYLRFGLISIRQAVAEAYRALHAAQNEDQRSSAETWLNELIWREFYANILYHFPYALRRSYKPQYQDIAWANDLEDLKAWQLGQTGYPLVDAAMRQLAATGWMHNRARMVSASFLVKNLLIDWRWGEAWFMQHLLDGDPASNNGGWQWTAGTGTDAAPYFRVFNPVTQSEKFDPQGVYIRCWLPELRQVPDAFIHTPWKMNAAEQRSSGCIIGQDYPHPVIDLAFSRQRVLDAYKLAGG